MEVVSGNDIENETESEAKQLLQKKKVRSMGIILPKTHQRKEIDTSSVGIVKERKAT